MENLENFICKIAIKMYMRSILTIFFGGKQYPEIPGGYPGPGFWNLDQNRNRTGTDIWKPESDRNRQFATRSTTNVNAMY